jgi:hypothetical protein
MNFANDHHTSYKNILSENSSFHGIYFVIHQVAGVKMKSQSLSADTRYNGSKAGNHRYNEKGQ